MRILVTNDDGIMAPGLQSLARTAAKAGHEVYIAAPNQQRSAASHCITLGKYMVAEEMQFPGICRAWSIEGMPADCVSLALRHLCKDVDVVLSGINHGYNAGMQDVIYSGTVAAAMEGAMIGKRALAVSLAPERDDTYDLAAELAIEIMERTYPASLPDYSIININYPGTDKALGVRAVPLRFMRYDSYYDETRMPDGRMAYKIMGDIEPVLDYREDDYSWLTRGYATVTVLTQNMANTGMTETLRAFVE